MIVAKWNVILYTRPLVPDWKVRQSGEDIDSHFLLDSLYTRCLDNNKVVQSIICFYLFHILLFTCFGSFFRSTKSAYLFFLNVWHTTITRFVKQSGIQ